MKMSFHNKLTRKWFIKFLSPCIQQVGVEFSFSTSVTISDFYDSFSKDKDWLHGKNF